VTGRAWERTAPQRAKCSTVHRPLPLANGANLLLPSLTRASKQETQVVYVLLLKAFSFIGFVQ